MESSTPNCTPHCNASKPSRDAAGIPLPWREVWTHPSVWCPTLVLAGLYTLMGACGWLHYHTRDDADIIGLLRGVAGVQPSGFTLMLSPWYGNALSFFYQSWPWGYWYDLAIISCYVLGYWWILYSMRRNGWKLSGMLLATIACVMGFLLWQPAFTLAGGFLTAAAVAPLITQIPPKPLRRLSRGEVLMSVVLILLATGYRVDAAGLALVVALAGFGILRGKEILGLRREAMHATGILGLLLGMVVIGWITSGAFPASLEADRWREYNNRRIAIQDYSRAVYDPSWEKSLGFSSNDFTMISYHMSMDSGFFSSERLKNIPLNASKPSLRDVIAAVMESMGAEALIIMTAVALACVLRPRLLPAAVSTLLILCLVQWHFDRLPPRVSLPPLGLLALMSVGAIGDQQGRARLLCRLTAAGLVLSTAWVVSHSLPGRLARIQGMVRNESRVRDFCNVHGIDRLLFWNAKTSSLLLFRDPMACAAISYDLGGWDSSHPARLAAGRKAYGEDIFAGVCRPGTYHCLMGPPEKHRALQIFLKEHGPGHTRFETVFQSGNTVLYRVVSDDAAATQPVKREP